jgi:hypothetical protein
MRQPRVGALVVEAEDPRRQGEERGEDGVHHEMRRQRQDVGDAELVVRDQALEDDHGADDDGHRDGSASDVAEPEDPRCGDEHDADRIVAARAPRKARESKRTVEREVRADDPDLTPEANELLTSELGENTIAAAYEIAPPGPAV